MPSAKPFCPVSTTRVKRPRGRPSKRPHVRPHTGVSRSTRLCRGMKPCRESRTRLEATVSEATINRLIDEACVDPRFEGLDRAFITEWVTSRLATLLTKYPWWYGRLDIDQPKPKRPCTEAQATALAKARQARQVRQGRRR